MVKYFEKITPNFVTVLPFILPGEIFHKTELVALPVHGFSQNGHRNLHVGELITN